MKGISNAKLLLLQPSLQKHGGGSVASIAALGTNHRLWLIAFLSFFTFASLLSVLNTTTTTTAAAADNSGDLRSNASPIIDALLHYASASNAAAGQMPDADLRAFAAVIRRRAPCNLLVFGLGHETPLWRALNDGGRTVFLDESEHYVARLEGRHPGLEAYEVAYTTRVVDLGELLAAARAAAGGECRPSQNLLFSECRLALNDLPNALYDVAWDVVLVDGPRGYSAESPGRMAAIFTAAVMARYRVGAGPTEVLVHDYEREVERVCSEEFLCRENLVAAEGGVAHFAIHGGGRPDDRFCVNRTAAL